MQDSFNHQKIMKPELCVNYLEISSLGKILLTALKESQLQETKPWLPACLLICLSV